MKTEETEVWKKSLERRNFKDIIDIQKGWKLKDASMK